jgi:hypothetical protein
MVGGRLCGGVGVVPASAAGNYGTKSVQGAASSVFAVYGPMAAMAVGD